jgi:ATP-dependent DNA helicase RecG
LVPVTAARPSGEGTIRRLAGDALSADEAKVDNMACRDFSGLDTLQASNLLRRLRDRGLLEKQGAGNRTHYTLVNPGAVTVRHPEQGNLPFEGGKRSGEGGKQNSEGGKRDLPPLPPALAAKLPAPRQRMGEATLRQLIRDLCGWQALRGEELATLLGKDLKYLRNKHLSVMVQSGELVF